MYIINNYYWSGEYIVKNRRSKYKELKKQAKELYEKILAEKDDRIAMLQEESGVTLDYTIESLNGLQDFFFTLSMK